MLNFVPGFKLSQPQPTLHAALAEGRGPLHPISALPAGFLLDSVLENPGGDGKVGGGRVACSSLFLVAILLSL